MIDLFNLTDPMIANANWQNSDHLKSTMLLCAKYKWTKVHRTTVEKTV